MNRPATFRQRDVKTAIRAAEAAGKTVYAVEVTRDGLIRLIVSPEAAPKEEPNPWDEDDS